MKLGKLPKEEDRYGRNLKLDKYLDRDKVPRLPLSQAWSKRVGSWGTFLNDELKCCLVSMGGHAIQTWTANNARPVRVSDADIEKAYSAISGYVPGRPETDQGATMLAMMKHWRTYGVGDHKILAFLEFNPRDHFSLMWSIRVAGGACLGLMLPRSAEGESFWHSTSDRPGSWGGHGFWMPDYDLHRRKGPTWGYLKGMSPEFVDRYSDEGYVPISEEWTGDDLVAPNGLRLDEVLADLKLVTQ